MHDALPGTSVSSSRATNSWQQELLVRNGTLECGALISSRGYCSPTGSLVFGANNCQYKRTCLPDSPNRWWNKLLNKALSCTAPTQHSKAGKHIPEPHPHIELQSTHHQGDRQGQGTDAADPGAREVEGG